MVGKSGLHSRPHSHSPSEIQSSWFISFYLRHHWRKNGFGVDKSLSIHVYSFFNRKSWGFIFFPPFSCNSEAVFSSLFPAERKEKAPCEEQVPRHAISFGSDWVSLLAVFDKWCRQPGTISCKPPFALVLGLQSGGFFNERSQPPFLIRLPPR